MYSGHLKILVQTVASDPDWRLIGVNRGSTFFRRGVVPTGSLGDRYTPTGTTSTSTDRRPSLSPTDFLQLSL